MWFYIKISAILTSIKGQSTLPNCVVFYSVFYDNHSCIQIVCEDYQESHELFTIVTTSREFIPICTFISYYSYDVFLPKLMFISMIETGGSLDQTIPINFVIL